MYEVYCTLSFGHESCIELCSNFRSMRETPEYLIQLPVGMKLDAVQVKEEALDWRENCSFRRGPWNKEGLPNIWAPTEDTGNEGQLPP